MTMVNCRPSDPMMKFSDAMAKVFAISRAEELLVPGERLDSITLTYWGIDNRNGWRTYLVCVNGLSRYYVDSRIDGITIID